MQNHQMAHFVPNRCHTPNPVDLWQLDTGIAQDILLVTAFIAVEHKYLDDLGFAPEIADVWKLWRGNRVVSPNS